MDRVQPARQQEKRQHDEELDGVAADDDGDIFSESADDDARRDLRRELRRESHDAERQDFQQAADHREQKLLRAEKAFQQHGAVFRLRHEGESEARRRRDEDDREHVAGQERLQHIVWHDGQKMIIIGKGAELFEGHVRRAASDDLGGQVPRRYPEVQRESDKSRRERRQQRIGDGMGENAFRVLVRAEL